jgi:hypothetical protein
VLTDGVPSPGDFDLLARAMGEARIRVSTVTVGSGADQTIMQDIADLAGGNYEHCDDPNEVPRVLEQEARRAAQPAADIEFRPITLRKLPEFDVASVPRLARSRYAPTSPKPPSEVLLLTADGDPLLSWWRYGRGVAVAATSAEVAGNPRWRQWSGYAGFWIELARLAARPPASPNAAAAVSEMADGVSLLVDARQPAGQWLDDAQAAVHVTDFAGSDGRRREFPLPHVAPGRYGGSLVLDRPGLYDLELSLSRDGQPVEEIRSGVALDYPAELRLLETNESLLRNVARVTGGSYQPPPEEIFADDGRRVVVTAEWWPVLLMAALVLFVIDVALRRMRLSPREV